MDHEWSVETTRRGRPTRRRCARCGLSQYRVDLVDPVPREPGPLARALRRRGFDLPAPYPTGVSLRAWWAPATTAECPGVVP